MTILQKQFEIDCAKSVHKVNEDYDRKYITIPSLKSIHMGDQ